MKKKTIKIEKILIPTALFLVFFIGMLANINRYAGFTDENDNFLGGLTIYNGGTIYQDYISQHMPFMYYLCAIFKILGASNAFYFRLYFYIFLAVLWVLLYIRYNKLFGSYAMIFYPILYIFNMYSFYNSCVISDQLQGIGFVILLLEFLNFYDKRELKINNCIAISVAVLFSFGTAFVSIYAIFIIACGVFFVEVKALYTKKESIIKSFRYLIGKYWKLIFIVALPFILWILEYLVKGNLKELYKGAYLVNREIYSKYLGGYGASIIGSFLTPIDSYFSTFALALNGIFTDPVENYRILMCYFINVCFFVYIGRKNLTAMFVCIGFILMSGTRSFGVDFHALPYFAISAMMAALLLEDKITNIKNGINKDKVTQEIIILSVILAIFAIPYLSNFSSILSIDEKLAYDSRQDATQYEYYIDRLTDEDDRIYLVNINFAIMTNSKRLPMPSGSLVPWMYEAYGDLEKENLAKYNPKIAIFNPTYEVWSHKLTDYAPEVVDYIEKNYTNYNTNGLTDLYIRNDYYEKALVILNKE